MTLLLAIFKSVCVLACLPACLSAFDQSVCMNVRRYPDSLKDVISGQEFGLKLCNVLRQNPLLLHCLSQRPPRSIDG